jgi:hypothetical protein
MKTLRERRLELDDLEDSRRAGVGVMGAGFIC